MANRYSDQLKTAARKKRADRAKTKAVRAQKQKERRHG